MTDARVKIVATIGPATRSKDNLRKLIQSGINVARLNFSHGTHEEHLRKIKWIRKAAKAAGKPVALIQDLQGPKIRLGDFEGIIPVQTGQHIRFGYQAKVESQAVCPCFNKL